MFVASRAAVSQPRPVSIQSPEKLIHHTRVRKACLTRPALYHRLLGRGFHLLYHQLAWAYDPVSYLVSQGAWRAWQQTALPYVVGPRVLELAHGPGHLLLDLNAHGYAVVGVDQSPAMVRLAQRRLKRAGVRLPLVRASAPALPFAAATFNTIVTTFPAPFIVAPATWRTLARLLVPGGRWVCIPAARLTRTSWAARGLRAIYRLTDQSAPPLDDPRWRSWIEGVTAAGLTAQWHQHSLPGSQVYILLAERPHPEISFAESGQDW